MNIQSLTASLRSYYIGKNPILSVGPAIGVFLATNRLFKNTSHYVFMFHNHSYYKWNGTAEYNQHKNINRLFVIASIALSLIAGGLAPQISREHYLDFIRGYTQVALNALKFTCSFVAPTAVIYFSLSEIIDKTNYSDEIKRTATDWGAIAATFLGLICHNALSQRLKRLEASGLTTLQEKSILLTCVGVAVLSYPYGFTNQHNNVDVGYRTFLGYPYGFASKVDKSKAALFAISLIGILSSRLRLLAGLKK